MRLRDIQVGIGNIGTKGRSRDPNREHVPHPCLSRIALLKRITPYPLNRRHPTENRRHQIAHGQIFDLLFALCGSDPRTLQKTTLVAVPPFISIPPSRSTPVPLATEIAPAKVVRSRWRDYRGRQDGAHLYEIAARALERGRWISQSRHTCFPFVALFMIDGPTENGG